MAPGLKSKAPGAGHWKLVLDRLAGYCRSPSMKPLLMWHICTHVRTRATSGCMR